MKILITGGSRGIGKALTQLFTSKGHEVYAPSRQELDLNLPVKLSRTDFDIIINNAGINPVKKILDINDNSVMRVNYYSPLEIIQQCIPYMEERNYGRVVNIGSIWIDKAKPGRQAYSASKNALHSLTKAIAVEYGYKGIIANTISPGFIETDLTYKNNTSTELNFIKSNIPLKRLGSVEEVCHLCYYLTVNNSYITGQNIIIDGGYSCGVF